MSRSPGIAAAVSTALAQTRRESPRRGGRKSRARRNSGTPALGSQIVGLMVCRSQTTERQACRSTIQRLLGEDTGPRGAPLLIERLRSEVPEIIDLVAVVLGEHFEAR